MKTLFFTLMLVTGAAAHANDEQILGHSLVKTTFELAQSRNKGTCDNLTKESLSYYCGGALFPAQKPMLLKTGSCGFGVKIDCANEIVEIYGSTEGMIYVGGKPKDVIEPMQTPMSFHDIEITEKK